MPQINVTARQCEQVTIFFFPKLTFLNYSVTVSFFFPKFSMDTAIQSQPTAPHPSLIVHLLPAIEEMEETTTNALLTLDNVVVWDSNEISHEPLLKSLSELKTSVDDWQRSLHNKLQGLWMDQGAEYSKYRNSIDRTLRARHCAELATLFPSLRTTLTEMPPIPGDATDEEKDYWRHMFFHGFVFDLKIAQGPASKLVPLLRRQLGERAIFNKVTLNHSERLMEAKRIDSLLLKKRTEKVAAQVNSVMLAVEKKIEASTRLSTHTIYRKGRPAKLQQPGRTGQTL